MSTPGTFWFFLWRMMLWGFCFAWTIGARSTPGTPSLS